MSSRPRHWCDECDDWEDISIPHDSKAGRLIQSAIWHSDPVGDYELVQIEPWEEPLPGRTGRCDVRWRNAYDAFSNVGEVLEGTPCRERATVEIHLCNRYGTPPEWLRDIIDLCNSCHSSIIEDCSKLQRSATLLTTEKHGHFDFALRQAQDTAQ